MEASRIVAFQKYMKQEERSEATLEKYTRDVRRFVEYLCDRPLDKASVVQYKNALIKEYAVASANSMLAALNAFFRFQGWNDLCVKQFRVQREAYCSENKELTREEYLRLLQAARDTKGDKLALLLETICGTGIRVSELKFITVEAVKRGEALVSCKGKNRRVFLVSVLRKKLLRYIARESLTTGSVFVSGRGCPIGRTAVWREMKRLCERAGVSSSKVFPHNLRHLFARTFYRLENDIAKLADILGHASINTTRVYIVSTGTEHRRKMESMRLVI
ncbi:MAG: integrase [Ruminococcaceae bacterium]|nr:integrase [Oscillospiraceae bacterium]